jgi:hypothetical protein
LSDAWDGENEDLGDISSPKSLADDHPLRPAISFMTAGEINDNGDLSPEKGDSIRGVANDADM